jgi:hypothetical protein
MDRDDVARFEEHSAYEVARTRTLAEWHDLP